MKTEGLLTVVLVTICLCADPGCHSGRPPQNSPEYSELPPQPPKLAADEIPASDWSQEIRALHPIKVYREGGNLVVVQGLNSGIESGKYIISPLSSTGPVGHFEKFTPVAVDGFPPLTNIYDYERGQR